MASIPSASLITDPPRTYNLRAQVIVEGLVLYVICCLILSVLIFSAAGFPSGDDYYHARVSNEIFVQQRFAIEFPWLPQTILSPQQFVDHHLLYHLYLAPWVYFGGMAGAKWAQVVITAGVFLAAWILMRRMGICWAAVWTLAMLGLSEPFLYRLLMIRTQGASLLFLIVALMILFERRYRWLIPLSFAYAWLYDGFILMPVFAVLYTAGEWLSEKRFDWRPVAYSVFGVIMGLIINPYFPRNIEFIVAHLGAKVDFESGIRVGSEWYPYSTSVLLENSAGAVLILVVGFLGASFASHRRDRVENTLLFAALLTLFMVFQSRRFIEYYPPFALLFCAAAWGRKPMLESLPHRLAKFVPYGAFLVGIIFAVITFDAARNTLENADNPRAFVGASEWLSRHTPQGASVFQTDWDDFPYLFYYNTSNTYLVGLDPTYLERANPSLWNQWVAITRGEVEQPSTLIRTVFGSEYVVSDRQHGEFIDQATNDPNMRLVYWDVYSMVWQIVP